MIEKVKAPPAWKPAGGLSALIGPGLAQWWFVASLAAAAIALASGAWIVAAACGGAAIAWGMGNDFEPWPPAWYGEKHHPGRPAWWVLVAWYLRNPLQNVGRYGLGVCHRERTVIGPAPVMSTHPREDATDNGVYPEDVPAWKWHVLWLGPLFPIPLPFVSYYSTRWKFYAGWQHNGFFGFKLNARQIGWNLW